MHQPTRHKPRVRHLLCWSLLLCGASRAIGADPGAHPAEAAADLTALLNVSLGMQVWSALDDLDTEPLGRFDDSGLNLAVSAHLPWRRVARGDLLAGLDVGAMAHESDITAPGDIGSVDTILWYFAPSLRWARRTSKRLRWNLEVGAGAYRAEMREFIELGYDFIQGTRHWNGWAAGGFVGASVDVDVGRPGHWSVNTGLRLHHADFGDVEAFGANLGALDGPITTWQLGLTYDWNGGR